MPVAHFFETDLDRRYDQAAASWQGRIAALGYPQAYAAAIALLCPPMPPLPRVLDAGCGTGAFAEAFAQGHGRIGRLTLLDPSRVMLDTAASRLQPSAATLVTWCQSLQSLQPGPGNDVILCAHVIEHCPDPVAALRSLGHSLAPKGALILIASRPHWCTFLLRLIWRHRSFAPARMLELIVAAGLVCRADMALPAGPPGRTSHAYLVTLTQPETQYADRCR
jgi:2-polyprenyl-3-methyl-5-hydroxy-6-metoxy-1,4-benzoquinol methylase